MQRSLSSVGTRRERDTIRVGDSLPILSSEANYERSVVVRSRSADRCRRARSARVCSLRGGQRYLWRGRWADATALRHRHGLSRPQAHGNSTWIHGEGLPPRNFLILAVVFAAGSAGMRWGALSARAGELMGRHPEQ